eukprot:scaffold5329_cov112-Isochrysis_galbana.AAC.7
MASKACTPSRISWSKMRTCSAHMYVWDVCSQAYIYQVTGLLHQDGVGRRDRRARGQHLVVP